MSKYDSNNWQAFWQIKGPDNLLQHKSGLTLKFARMPFGKSFLSFFTVLKANETLLNLFELPLLKEQANDYLVELPQVEKEKTPPSKVNIFHQEDFSHPLPILIAMSKEITELNQALIMQQKAVEEYAKAGLRQAPQAAQFGQAIFEQIYIPKLEFYQAQKNLWLGQAKSEDRRTQQSLQNFQGWIDTLRTNIQIMIACFQKDEAIHQGKVIH